MLINLALTQRPPSPLTAFYADFFSQPKEDIEKALIPYLISDPKSSDQKVVIPIPSVDEVSEMPSIEIDEVEEFRESLSETKEILSSQEIR